MIAFYIEGGLPAVNPNLSKIMQNVAELMEDSVKLNFIEGGRPAWEPLKSNIAGRKQAFYPPGSLYRSIKKSSGDTWAEVSAGEGLPYARIQQEGGFVNIPITAKSRKFFWVMFFNTGDEKWKWMALTKRSVYIMHIPPRPYMMFQQEDVGKILDMIGNGIIRFEQSDSSSTVFNES